VPQFKYTGKEPASHHYATAALGSESFGVVEPGDVIEADENPDPSCFEEVAAKKAAKS
jgi:hypothetical protein